MDYDDLDFENHGETGFDSDNCEQEKQHSTRGKFGPDIMWREVKRYNNRESYVESDIPEELKMFNLKKSWITKYAENEVWACKFSQKAGYLKYSRMIKLEFLNHSTEVVLLDNCEPHKHEADVNYKTSGKKYLWTVQQEELILPLARNKLAPLLILR